MAEFLEVMKHRKRMCDALKQDCGSCGLCSDINNRYISCNKFILDYSEQAEEIIMKWAKEHPVKTNADKFKEVFGYDAELDTCPVECLECAFDFSTGCNNCKLNDFWKQEYKEPRGETNDRTKE